MGQGCRRNHQVDRPSAPWLATTRDGRRVVVESRWVLDPKGRPGAVIEINTPSDAS
jgi:hypothetical protein